MSCLRCGPEPLAQARSVNAHAARNASTSTLRDTSQWVWAARRGIPFRTNWKQQQLVMQSISQARSLQLPTFPQSQGKARRKPDHPFRPTRKPAVPGTRWEAVSAEEPFHEDHPAHRQEELALLPSDSPRSGRSGSGLMPSTIPTVINKKFYEKIRENLGLQESKPHPSVGSDC